MTLKGRTVSFFVPAVVLIAAVAIILNPFPKLLAFDNLPAGFDSQPIISDITDPAGMRFAPDGRLFIGERITGRLLVASYDEASDQWTVNPTPFYTFPTPRDGSGNPERVRSAGLRDIVFDPNYASNGYLYAFYMNDDTRQNRVVRIKADSSNPDIADASFGEELLIDLPFNDTTANGSHNGGALAFGFDGKLYITTGDGWTGEPAGDPVQSLTTFTGKVLRLNADGTIPADNPFYTQTVGDYRAIYALGLRNPYSMSRHPETGALYINEARGDAKADIYIVEARANYGHEGSGIGNLRDPWTNASTAGSQLITGGAWYPAGGSFPTEYEGAYFVALWGSNASNRGQISYIESDSDTAVTAFETNVGLDVAGETPIKPVLTRIGPDGSLYYLLTTYETTEGTIYRVRFTTQETVARPLISPEGGTFADPVEVSLSTTTADSIIYYTLDGTDPTESSPVYAAPFMISEYTVVRARAYRTDYNPSAIASATFTIGDQGENIPPIADAGKDVTVEVGTVTVLDGSGSLDPDGDDELLRDEQWTQISGPTVEIVDADEEVAYVTPTEIGTYIFELSVTDPAGDSGTDQVTVTVVERLTCPDSSLVMLYRFDEGSGTTFIDHATTGSPIDLTLSAGNVTWLADGGIVLDGDETIETAVSPTKLIEAAQESDELSIAVWLQPANVTQEGPARIVTLSDGPNSRNFMLGQGRFGGEASDVFDVRLRTDDSSIDENGRPALTSENIATTDLTHLVFTRNEAGQATIYSSGDIVGEGDIPGTFANWDAAYRLAVGNEIDGGRPWVGNLYQLALYSCALSGEEVATLFAEGYGDGGSATPTPEPTSTSTPEMTSTPTQTPTATPTDDPVSSPTSTATPTQTPAASSTPTAVPTATEEPTPSSNLAPNPSFESDPTVDYDTTGSGSMTWTTDESYSGSYSIAISQPSGTAGSSYSRWLLDNRAAVPSEATGFTYSAWVKGEGVGSNNARLVLSYWTASGRYVRGSTESLRLTPNGTWQQFTLAAPDTVTSDAATVRIEVRLYGGGTIWVDELNLTADGVSSSPTATPTAVSATSTPEATPTSTQTPIATPTDEPGSSPTPTPTATATATSLPTATPDTSGDNLLPNPGFETDPVVEYGRSGDGQTSWSTAAFAGARSLRIEQTSFGGYTRWYSRDQFALDGATGYTLSLWATGENISNDRFRVVVTYWDDNSIYRGQEQFWMNPTTGWQQFSFGNQEAIPSLATQVRVEFRLYGRAEVWFDEVSLTLQ